MRLSEMPDIGELVMGTVEKVKDFGVTVTLDEYPSVGGFIHITEVASGWVKYVRDYVREGQKVVCKVIRVESGKGVVDLSLKRVNEHQRREKIQEWKNETKAEKLFEILANRMNKDVKECYEEFGYKLIEKYNSLYSAFEKTSADQKTLKESGFTGEWVKHFIEVAKENIVPPSVEITGMLEITCPLPDGVKYIKEALSKAESSKDVVVQYVGAPMYRIIVKSSDYKNAEGIMKKAAERAIAYIKEHNGKGEFHRK
ncbi:MAG: translation initiation factor IF-2 subunit alpha [Euryarchaeota archaeon CG01_land_8_20_14_3_00_38_12]|nr:MAG: translation initiation factor IF-2 subunit alpha [Euryarchaeota archaeon CG01_land_8_20_14_3_00_38_12]PJB20937.1 MAG: translation initiation factor IF-2 subunit alpha [Euryarchaeota archaeon CG_4_9_14_3_um_filter_38_12]